jgi:dephospho-CoA kinase
VSVGKTRARLGVAAGEVVVVPHDARWAHDYRIVRARLRTILPNARIEHVGSTAIPDCAAKPIIDVSVGLGPGTRLRIDAARSIGLEFRSVSPESTHFVFRDKNGRHVAHVHVNSRNSEAELKLLRFRDFLRSHPDSVREYVLVKHRILAARGGWTRYTEAKEPFFRGMDSRVRDWARRTRWTPSHLEHGSR